MLNRMYNRFEMRPAVAIVAYSTFLKSILSKFRIRFIALNNTILCGLSNLVLSHVLKPLK